MSQFSKRKHVSKEMEVLDDLPTDKSIVKIIMGKGNNLHLAQTDNGEQYLVSMPTKFRKHVWVKRGDFVLVEPIEEGDKVKAEISHVLLKPHIKQLKKEGKWPKAFDEDEELIEDKIDKTVTNLVEESDSELSLEGNPNHNFEEGDSEEESSEDEQSDNEIKDDKNTK